MSVDPVGAALGLVPLAGDAYDYWRNRDEVANLFRELDAAIQRDARIPHGDREDIRAQLQSQRVDPYFLGGIQQYMQNADLDALPGIRRRLNELLVVAEDTDAGTVVSIVVEAIVKHVPRAFRRDREAAYHESRISTQQITSRVEGAEDRLAEQAERLNADVIDTVVGRIERLEVALRPQDADAGTSGLDAGSGPERFLRDLGVERPGDAEVLRERWSRDGPDGLRSIVESPDGWLLGASGEAWQAIARLLSHSGHRVAGVVAYREAVVRGVADPVRTLLRASGAARLAGDGADATALFHEARSRDANHPAVLLHELDALREEPDEVLRRLAGYQSPEPSDMATAEALRAQALLIRGDEHAAYEAANRAISIEPGHLGARELRALSLLIPNERRYVAREKPDHDELDQAIADLVAGLDDLRRQRRYGESGHFVARLVKAYIASDNPRAARAALQAPLLLDDERQGDAAVDLAHLAVMLGRSDIALTLLPAESSDDSVRLFRGAALARGKDRSEAAAGVSDLQALSRSGDEAARRFAATSLLIAASEHADIEWDEHAASLLLEDDPVAHAVIRADFLSLHHRHGEAENVLLLHSQDPGALHALVGVAIDRGDVDTAMERARTLLAVAPNGRNRFLYAEVLARAEQVGAAIDELSRLGSDATQPDGLRLGAFNRAADLAVARRDWPSTERVTVAWLDAFEDDADAVWTRALALARLARHSEGLDLFEAGRLVVVTRDHAVLLAEILYRSASVDVAVRQIASLSAQFDRDDERLEALVLFAALRRNQPLPADLTNRVREGFATFPTKFPESKLMWVVDAPTTPEEFDEFARRFVAHSAESQVAAAREVTSGRAPVAVLAASAGAGVGATWARLQAWPLGFGGEAIGDLERGDASEAIGRGAVWDSSALVIAASLHGELRQLLRKALPTSRLPQAVLDDLDLEAASPGSRDTDDGPALTVGYDSQTDRGTITETAAEAARGERERMETALALAKDFPAAYDAAPESTERWAAVLMAEAPPPRQLATVAATIAVAKRLGLPVFSDDRVVRGIARHEGLRTFGTVGLLDALAERGLLARDARHEARRQLLSHGAWGVRAQPLELLTIAADAQWDCPIEVAVALTDPGAWSQDRVATWHMAVDLLEAVFEAQPGEFRRWVWRILDSAASAMPEVPAMQRINSLLITAWDLANYPPSNSNAFFQALMRQTRSLPHVHRPWPPVDVPLQTVSGLLSHLGDFSEDERFLMFLRIIRRLDPFDCARAWTTFVRSGPDPRSGARRESPPKESWQQRRRVRRN